MHSFVEGDPVTRAVNWLQLYVHVPLPDLYPKLHRNLDFLTKNPETRLPCDTPVALGGRSVSYLPPSPDRRRLGSSPYYPGSILRIPGFRVSGPGLPLPPW